MTWLSVATVVKDDPVGFERTMESLAEQDVTGIEWVVVDGSADRSSVPDLLDGTLRLPEVRYVHERPKGIYPAMNRALKVGVGKYAYFLNAGDTFYDEHVLFRMRHAMSADPAWAFGPVEIIHADGSRVTTPAWNYGQEKERGFSRGLFPPHQGTIAARELLRYLGGFDERYSISADYALALRLSLVEDPVLLPFVVATFREGGVSTQRWQESFREFHRARAEILRPSGLAAVRARWETARHFGLVYAHREIRPRLSWLARRPS